MDSKKTNWICVTTDHVEPDLNWEAQEYARAGVEYRRYQLRRATASELIDISRDADVLVVDQSKITAEVISGLDNCKLIIRHGDGYDNLDIDAATQAGILCANQPGFWSREVAEHAFSLGLSLALRIPLQQDIARRPRIGKNAGWDLHRAMPFDGLSSLTVGIIGYGNMGSAFARRLSGFGCKVIAYDKYKTNYSDAYCQEKQLSDLFEQCDVLSLHVPQTPETIYMVNDEFLGQFKKPIYLINTARGKVVCIADLVKHLKSGQVKGACLDVLEYEKTSFEDLHANELPKEFQYLIDADNVLLSPHVGGWTHESNVKLAQVLANKIIAKFSN